MKKNQQECGGKEARVVLCLGSNIEPRRAYLDRAQAALCALPATRFSSASETEETEPVGVPPEFAHLRFLNQLAVFETELEVHEFSRRMHAVEDALGRTRTVRNGPRTIDLDLVDFDGLAVDEPDLVLPHPRARERAFVMEPWRRLRREAADGDAESR